MSCCRFAWIFFIARAFGARERVFERDAQGNVVKMLDRRENNDLVWKKVK